MTLTPYNYHFEVASTMFLMILLIVIYTKKQLTTRTYRFFRIHIWLLFFANYLGAFCGIVNSIDDSTIVVWKHVCNVMDSLLGYMIFGDYFLYLLSLLYKADWKERLVRVSAIPIVLLCMAVITSPWHGLYYRITNDGQVQDGILYYIAQAVVMIYLMGIIVFLLVRGQRLSGKHKLLIIFMNLFLVLSFVIQVKCHLDFRLRYPLFAVLIFLYFLTMRSPDYYIDHLTGLYNINGFMELLQERAGYRKPMHCLLLRINNYNSLLRIFRYDHLTKMRQNIADILLGTKARGRLYRISSSTFAVICDDAHQVEVVHQVMLEDLPQRWVIGEEVIAQEYCFYQLEYTGDETDFNKLAQWIHYARSDHHGHHQPGELIPLKYDTVSESEYRQEVSNLIDEAILDQSMEIHMQPVYSLEEDKITSLEVLSRLKDRAGKYVNPEFFIHVAEDNHTIVQLGELIFRRACVFASQNHIFELGIEYMNINVSPGQCQYEHLTERLVSIAQEYHIPVERIHVEITESEFQDSEAVEKTLVKIRDAGMKVALDDFGTGCSTLLSILDMPVDYVKIDKSLVWSYDAGDNQFLDDLMPVIKLEGKQVIAEGIETEEHIEIFRRLKGDFLQGYYFSKPVPEREFVSFVKKFNQISPIVQA